MCQSKLYFFINVCTSFIDHCLRCGLLNVSHVYCSNNVCLYAWILQFVQQHVLASLQRYLLTSKTGKQNLNLARF